jgi:hypothetical protein
MDEYVLTSLILSIASMLSNIILHYKLKHCHSMCCDSDCVSKSEPNTPREKQPFANFK